MLLPKFVRENREQVVEMLKKRHSNIDLQFFTEKEEQRLKLIAEVEEKKSERNASSKAIGVKKKAGEDSSEIMSRMKELSETIKALDKRLLEIETEVKDFCLGLPNILADEVPFGADESSNEVVKTWGEVPQFNFDVKDHHSLGESLGILDFERAAKITGSRFVVLKGAAARLERALIQFFLNENTDRGYDEVLPPFIVNRESMTGTGQLPKFEEDLFKLHGNKDNYFLIPTAEVPVTNLYRSEIFKDEELPVRHTAYTPCFRAEAGSAGRDTRGIIRQHQFDKVEVVKFCKPEESESEHQALVSDAENLLQKLGLAYRISLLSSGDTGFGARKCFDLEVWLPSRDAYVEISSCSNFGDFQANRAQIRYKDKESGKNRPVHTLNGSALAVGRTVVAIMENYQQEDSSIAIPEVLQGYMGGLKVIQKA